jgi:hypothetical protein
VKSIDARKSRGELMPPSDLSNQEQKYWSDLENLIGGLLDELKKGGWLRNEAEFAAPGTHKAFGQMLEISARFNGHMATAKALNEAIESKNAELTSCLVELGVGFTEDNVGNAWIYDMFSVFIESTEMLKNNLLLVLRTNKDPFKPRMTLGELRRSIENRCPQYGPPFFAEVNVGLRNAFSHDLYWMKRKSDGSIELYYVEELGGREISDPLTDILTVIAKQELLTTCVAETLGKKAQSGYFK